MEGGKFAGDFNMGNINCTNFTQIMLPKKKMLFNLIIKKDNRNPH